MTRPDGEHPPMPAEILRECRGILVAFTAYQEAWSVYQRRHHELMRHVTALVRRLAREAESQE